MEAVARVREARATRMGSGGKAAAGRTEGTRGRPLTPPHGARRSAWETIPGAVAFLWPSPRAGGRPSFLGPGTGNLLERAILRLGHDRAAEDRRENADGRKEPEDAGRRAHAEI